MVLQGRDFIRDRLGLAVGGIITGKHGNRMFAEILAGLVFDNGVYHLHPGADRSTEKGAAKDAGAGIDMITGDRAVKAGNHRNMLQGIDDVDQVPKRKTVFAEETK